MQIFVTAKPNAREDMIEPMDATHFTVAVKEPPRAGMANAAIAKALARYFDVAPSRVRLVSGFASKQKVFEVL